MEYKYTRSCGLWWGSNLKEFMVRGPDKTYQWSVEVPLLLRVYNLNFERAYTTPYDRPPSTYSSMTLLIPAEML